LRALEVTATHSFMNSHSDPFSIDSWSRERKRIKKIFNITMITKKINTFIINALKVKRSEPKICSLRDK
jgi:hypothetical protein